MASVTFCGISKHFGRNEPVLRSVDLNVQAGEFLVLVGPSGSGKTTLLRLAAGLEHPSAGEILLDGRPVSGIAAHRRNLAMVFQGESLYPQMTVYQNLAFGNRRKKTVGSWFDGLSKWIPFRGSNVELAAENDHQVRRAARWLGIETMLGRWPYELSGGERQRVALGRAVVRNPAAFLLDEPLSSLDPHLRRRLARDFQEIRKQMQTTTIMVTHDAGQAMELADRIAVLNQGELVQVGTPEQVYCQPANRFVADLLGSSDLNTIEGELEESGGEERVFRCSAGIIRLGDEMVVPQHPGRTTLAFRAEDLLIRPAGEPVSAATGSRIGLLKGRVTGLRFGGAEQRVLLCMGESNNNRYDRISWQSILPKVQIQEADSDARGFDWLQPGAAVETSVPASRCLWLDGDTGKNLLKDV